MEEHVAGMHEIWAGHDVRERARAGTCVVRRRREVWAAGRHTWVHGKDPSEGMGREPDAARGLCQIRERDPALSQLANSHALGR